MADDADAFSEFTVPGSVTNPFVIVPDHELLRLIGRGSYGEVWLGRNTLGALRAIKIVYGSNFRNRKPFEREFNGVKKFEPLSRLHDGLMDILQVGRNDTAGYFYCVMELADDASRGQEIDPERYEPRTLAHDITKFKRLPIGECRRLGAAIASALEFLHGRGLIHRDIKPSNIVFVNGVPKLADIGLVAEAREARSYVGTEGFIPPEGPGTVRADIYSLGKVLYEISTGMDRHDYPELPTLVGDARQGDEMFEFNRIFLKACRSEAARRYRTAHAMAEDLLALDRDSQRFRRRRNRCWLLRILKASAGLAVLAGGAWLLPPQKDISQRPAAGLRGLVSWWRAENSTRDETGGNDGTKMGSGKVGYAPGVIGRAFVFDGLHRDRIEFGNPPNLRLQDLTISAWIKRANATNVSLDDNHEDGSNTGAGADLLGYNRTGTYFGMKDDGRLILGANAVNGVLSAKVVADVYWHQAAVTRTGTNVVFYIDGAPASRNVAYDGTFYFDSPGAIGSAGGGMGGSFWGMIDEFRIFNRGLSAAEIRSIYDADCAASTIVPEGTFVPPLAGLVDWWSAEGSSNGLSGLHPIRLINGAGFALGKAGRAFRFNGRNQCILVPRTPDLDIRDQLTLACWVKLDPDNDLKYFQGLIVADFYTLGLSCGYSSWRMGGNFAISTDSGKSFSVDSFPDTAELNGGGAVLSVDEWHHLAGTYDGTQLQLYVDGRPWGKPMPHTGTISPMPANSLLTIGSEDGVTMATRKGRYFKGLIDEICIYRRALTADELAEIYAAGEAGLSPAPNCLPAGSTGH